MKTVGPPYSGKLNVRWDEKGMIGRSVMALSHSFTLDFVITVKGNKQQAVAIREQCREFLEGKLKLTLNMEKTQITHINDGFNFLGQRIIRKRGTKGTMRIVTGVPQGKAKAFAHSLIKELTGDYSCSMIDKVEKINQKLKGWSQFYCYTDYTTQVYSKIDRIVFWKLAHWLGRKYRCSIKSLLNKWWKHPEPGKAKTWVLFGKTTDGNFAGKSLYRLVNSPRMRFRWRLPEMNPHLRVEERKTITSCYADVAMAVGQG